MRVISAGGGGLLQSAFHSVPDRSGEGPTSPLIGETGGLRKTICTATAARLSTIASRIIAPICFSHRPTRTPAGPMAAPSRCGRRFPSTTRDRCGCASPPAFLASFRPSWPRPTECRRPTPNENVSAGGVSSPGPNAPRSTRPRRSRRRLSRKSTFQPAAVVLTSFAAGCSAICNCAAAFDPVPENGPRRRGAAQGRKPKKLIQ